MSNLKLWKSVSETDPKHTKSFKGPGGFSGTSLNATAMVQKATELWGPLGKGWGYEILEDRIDQGPPIIDQETKTPTGAHLSVHTIKLRLWWGGEPAQYVEHYGHTPFVFQNKYGIGMDLEPAKKSLTDAIKKCLTMLGFSADVMLGDFEDPDYRQQVADKVRVEEAIDKVAEQAEIDAERAEWLDKHIKILSTAVNLHELETVFKGVYKTLQLRKDSDGIKKATKAKDLRKAELEEEEKYNAASV